MGVALQLMKYANNMDDVCIYIITINQNVTHNADGAITPTTGKMLVRAKTKRQRICINSIISNTKSISKMICSLRIR